jgi:predicted nucleic acid-binding protein
VSTVFVDTSGFFALYARNDADHQQAVDLFRQASSERWQLVTTNAVVMETHALLLNRVRDGRTVALRFLDDMTSSGVRVERVASTIDARTLGRCGHAF